MAGLRSSGGGGDRGLLLTPHSFAFFRLPRPGWKRESRRTAPVFDATSNGGRDLFLRNGRLLFREAVSHDDGARSMEEVEDSIVHAVVLRSRLVDAVSEVCGFRPPQSVAAFLQPLETNLAFCACVGREAAKQPDQRDSTGSRTVEDELASDIRRRGSCRRAACRRGARTRGPGGFRRGALR